MSFQIPADNPKSIFEKNYRRLAKDFVGHPSPEYLQYNPWGFLSVSVPNVADLLRVLPYKEILSSTVINNDPLEGELLHQEPDSTDFSPFEHETRESMDLAHPDHIENSKFESALVKLPFRPPNCATKSRRAQMTINPTKPQAVESIRGDVFQLLPLDADIVEMLFRGQILRPR